MELLTRYYDEDIVLKRALDIACPAVVTRRTALFYIHGGGWNAGSRESYHEHLHYFSRKGYLCASAGYRLVPSVRLEGQMEDVATGYDRFLAYIEEKRLGIDRVIVIGSSAGAHLASLLALTEPATFNEGLRLRWRKPAACVSVNGPGTLERWDGMNEEIKPLIENMLGVKYGEESDRFRKASPIAHVGESSPDFLFLIVGKEKFFPHFFIHQMSEKLKRFGKRSEVVLFPEAEHGFFYGLKSQQQQEALAVLESFIERYG